MRLKNFNVLKTLLSTLTAQKRSMLEWFCNAKQAAKV